MMMYRAGENIRIHESVLIAKLTWMLRKELKRPRPDIEYVATLQQTLARLQRQLRARPQARQTTHRRRKHA